MDLKNVNEGDTVTVRGTVKRSLPGFGVLVELFSKTDQYDAWIREDLVADHTPKPAIPAEPEPGAYLIGGETCWRDRPSVGGTHGHSWRVIGQSGWRSWEDVWDERGGPDVTITRLVPEVAEVELPWAVLAAAPELPTGGGHRIRVDFNPEDCVTVTTNYTPVDLSPAEAEAMAAALLTAAKKAREATA